MGMETLLTAIAIIKQSRVYGDERCQALVTSLKDCLVSIQGDYSYRCVYLCIRKRIIFLSQSKLILKTDHTVVSIILYQSYPYFSAEKKTETGTEDVKETGTVTERGRGTENGTENVTEVTLLAGKVLEPLEDTENVPGVQTGKRSARGNGKGTGITVTDIANLVSLSQNYFLFLIYAKLLHFLNPFHQCVKKGTFFSQQIL